MIDVTAIGSWALIDLAGEFDLNNAEGVRSVTVDLLDQGVTDVSVDLSQVSFMGAAALNALHAAHQAVETAADARLIIVGASSFARRLFTMTRLEQILPLPDRPIGGDLSLSGRDIVGVGAVDLGYDASNGQRVGPRRQSPADPTVTENLRRIVRSAEQDVPGCRAASICLLAHGQPRTAAVTNEVAVQVDVAQYRVNEGPCLWAARTSQTVRVNLLGDDHRFTRFAPLAHRVGIQAVLSVPVITDAHIAGTLNLYFPSPSAFELPAETVATASAHRDAYLQASLGGAPSHTATTAGSPPGAGGYRAMTTAGPCHTTFRRRARGRLRARPVSGE